jgi:hypothetical protein
MLTHSACSSGPERRIEDTHSTIRWNTTTIEVHVSESRNSEAFLLLHNLAAMHLIFWLVHLDYTVLLTWGCKLSIERISFRYTVTCTGAVYAGFRCCAWNCYHSPDLLTGGEFCLIGKLDIYVQVISSEIFVYTTFILMLIRSIHCRYLYGCCCC